jgi:hypothetical protein
MKRYNIVFDSIFKSAEKSLIHKINLEFKDSLNNKTNFTTEDLGTC